MNLNNLAALYHATGRREEAERLYLRSLDIKTKLLGTNHIDVGVTLNNLAVFYKSQRRLAEAAALYRRALGILDGALDPFHPKLTICRENHDRLLREMNGSTATKRGPGEENLRGTAISREVRPLTPFDMRDLTLDRKVIPNSSR